MIKLTEMSYRAPGTVRENGLKKCDIISQDDLKKQPRRTYEFYSDGNVEFVH